MPYLQREAMKVVPKEWGAEYWIWNDNGYCGKILKLRQAHYCSYHAHKNKMETFYILSGEIRFTLNGSERILIKGDRVHINPMEYHKFEGIKDSEIMEVSTLHSDDDSYRQTVSGKRFRVVIDIDGVLAEDGHTNIYTTDYKKLKLIKGARDALNRLHNKGAFIILYTSRRQEVAADTFFWLGKNLLHFDDVVFNKPSGDVYVDDRAIRFGGWDKCLKSILPKKSQ